jgi:phage-related protein
MRYFETKFLEDADIFFAQLHLKTVKKIIYHIDLAEQTNDPKLFKKIQHDIWEFRTKSLGLQIRLLAFWDKSDKHSTLVIATHGFIKKENKLPNQEIERAIKLRNKYFENKTK